MFLGGHLKCLGVNPPEVARHKKNALSVFRFSWKTFALGVFQTTPSCEFPKTRSQVDAMETKSHFSVLDHLFPRKGVEASSCAYLWVTLNRCSSQPRTFWWNDRLRRPPRLPWHAFFFFRNPLQLEDFSSLGFPGGAGPGRAVLGEQAEDGGRWWGGTVM